MFGIGDKKEENVVLSNIGTHPFLQQHAQDQTREKLEQRKKEYRKVIIQIQLTKNEKDQINKASDKESLPLSTFMRRVCLRESEKILSEF